jgi:NADH-ubiquinone oxidoreductase chain 5
MSLSWIMIFMSVPSVLFFCSYIFPFLTGFFFIMGDLVYFVEWDIVTLNSVSIVMTFLFEYIHCLWALCF